MVGFVGSRSRNGSGGNITTRVRGYRRRRVFTQPKRHKAFFYLVLMDNVGFSATRDPVTAIFAEDLSCQRIISLLSRLQLKLKLPSPRSCETRTSVS